MTHGTEETRKTEKSEVESQAEGVIQEAKIVEVITIEEDFMSCSKCGGLMFYEKFISEEIEDFSGWRCVICGEIVDEVILKNRAKR